MLKNYNYCNLRKSGEAMGISKRNVGHVFKLRVVDVYALF